MTVSERIEQWIADAPLSAHVATSVDDRPHVAPVWYVYEAESLWVLTGGKKLRNVRQNPRVAVSIERADESGVDWAVQLLGTAREVDDEERIAWAQAEMDRKYRDTDEDEEADVDEADGTDAGETDGTDADEDTNPVTDGGEPEWALLKIAVGSATGQSYREAS